MIDGNDRPSSNTHAELRETQAALDAERKPYYDLYNMAPAAYCTVSEKGLILEANLNSFKLLKLARGMFVGQTFSQFIIVEDQYTYGLFSRKLFESFEPQACELRMVKQDGTVFWAKLSATLSQDENTRKLDHVERYNQGKAVSMEQSGK